ncbi:unnamed protein product [Blepharisma stoltei]|uniref:Uncharacterized protein n=1 Tax=Blepharisma stoltei TaxID=1481888 RepID=A0AAU9IJC1_9CILI|nr:unnamed protein product [Blepharisma stoltei]
MVRCSFQGCRQLVICICACEKDGLCFCREHRDSHVELQPQKQHLIEHLLFEGLDEQNNDKYYEIIQQEISQNERKYEESGGSFIIPEKYQLESFLTMLSEIALIESIPERP